ncbi:uncharacterized protein LOC135491262 [Lineus longissimus]|uniref:uncharacterized protein LOC135491262 n=1 Tax=Lineus longissimus TaxID=88925 RepID=UPI002B4FAFA7
MKYLTYLRLTCVGLLLYSTLSVSLSIHLTWQAGAAFILFLVSFYVLKTDQNVGLRVTSPFVFNPLKKQKKEMEKTLDDLTEEQIHKFERQISDFVTYDAENCLVLERFEPLKQQSQCTFAKKARVWGARDWQESLSLEENVCRSLATFYKFVLLVPELGLDAFLFEVPQVPYASDIQTFGQSVRRVLTVLSDADPTGYRCMDKTFISRKEWAFQFNRMTFFVTTFGPFYSESHPRYAFGCDQGFILLQPELSFAFKDLPSDTPKTNWDNPLTVRDRIRVAFRDAGRPYKIRPTIFYPMTEDIVRPLQEEDPVIEWWVKATTMTTDS